MDITNILNMVAEIFKGKECSVFIITNGCDTSHDGMVCMTNEVTNNGINREIDISTKDSDQGNISSDENNCGRPRKLLIEGVTEKRISVDVPVTLIKKLKKLSKKEKRSLKELLITPAIDIYMRNNNDNL